jgi:hypothetical protein
MQHFHPTLQERYVVILDAVKPVAHLLVAIWEEGVVNFGLEDFK